MSDTSHRPRMDQPRTSAAGPLAVLALCGLILLGSVVFLSRVAADYGIAMNGYRTAIRAVCAPFEEAFGAIPRDGDDQRDVRTKAHLVGMLVGFPAYFLALGVVMRRMPRNHKGALALIVAGSVVFRLIYALSPPLLENSVHRYLWDGAVSASGISPYRFSPEEVRKAKDPAFRVMYPEPDRTQLQTLSVESRLEMRVNFHYELITHPHLRTIYPPISQLVFGTCGVLARGNQDLYKLVNAAIDLAVLALVIVMLGRLGKDRNLCVLYGWSPLVLKEFANSGHADTLAGFFMLAGVMYLCSRSQALAGASFACASLVKVYPLVMALVFFRALGRRGLVVMLGLGFIGFLPQLLATDYANHGLAAYARRWESNASVHALVGKILGVLDIEQLPQDPIPGSTAAEKLAENYSPRRPITKAIATGMLLVALLLLARRPQETPEEIAHLAFLAVGAVLIFSPVVLPWYLCWLLPHLALFPSAAWLWLTFGINLWYSAALVPHIPEGQMIREGLRLIEYIPFYALLLWEMARARRTP